MQDDAFLFPAGAFQVGVALQDAFHGQPRQRIVPVEVGRQAVDLFFKLVQDFFFAQGDQGIAPAHDLEFWKIRDQQAEIFVPRSEKFGRRDVLQGQGTLIFHVLSGFRQGG